MGSLGTTEGEATLHVYQSNETSMYKPHPRFGSAEFESFSRVILLQTTYEKQSKFRNTDIEVVAIFHIYQV